MNKRDCRKKPEQSPAVVELVALPAPRLNLNDMEAVRREMARVYRDMRNGVIATQDGTRLVYVLSEMRKMFEAVKAGALTDSVGVLSDQRAEHDLTGLTDEELENLSRILTKC